MMIHFKEDWEKVKLNEQGRLKVKRAKYLAVRELTPQWLSDRLQASNRKPSSLNSCYRVYRTADFLIHIFLRPALLCRNGGMGVTNDIHIYP